MDDLISRSALLAAYDKAHQGPPGGARKLIEEAPAVNTWHVFRQDEDGRLGVDCAPNDGEDILWYRSSLDYCTVIQWDDDMYAEYCCSADGDEFEDGDAWMEMPEGPH